MKPSSPRQAENDELYRIVAETATDAIITIDDKSVVRFVNRAAERIFGHTADEILGEPVTMLMPRRLASKHLEGFFRYLDTGEKRLDWRNFEVTGLHKSGEEILLNISFGEFQEGPTHLFTAIIRDVTERKRNEEKLKESEEDYRGLVEATTAHVWQLDERGNLSEFPQWWVDLTGQGYEESTNYGWAEFVHPEDRERVKNDYAASLASKQPASLIFRLRDKNDDYHWFAARGVPFYREDGSFRKWICTLSDISQRMAAEQDLRESEERYRALIQASAQVVWTAEKDGSSEDIYQWLTRISGKEVRSVAEVEALMHPEDLAPAREAWQASLKDRSLFEYTCRFLTKDQTFRYYSARGCPMFNADGSFRRWVGTFSDVTEQVEARNALEKKEIHMRTIVEGSPECIKIHSGDSKLLDMNPAGLEMIEADSLEAVLGMSLEELLSKEDAKRFRAMNKKVLAGEPQTREFQLNSLKGSTRWVETHAVPLRDNTDGTTSILSVTRDISLRKSSDEALRKSEEQFRELFENANDLIYTHDLLGNFTSLNRAGERITGYPREEALKLNIKDVVAPEFLELAQKKTLEKISGRSDATSYETEIIRKDGKRATLDVSTRLIYENGKPVGVQGIARDVTDRREAQEALRKSEQLLRVVTDTVPALITYFDRDLVCRFANGYYLEWTGKQRSEVLGKTLKEIAGERAGAELEKEFRSALDGDAFTLERYAVLESAAREGDEQSFLRVNYVPDRAHDGKVVGVYAFVIDLTETKRAEDALRRSEDQLAQAQKLESIGRLAGGIAHDFNNMLTAINGYSELTLRKLGTEDPLRRNIEEIRRAGVRSAELTSQLLAFSRRQILQPQILNINEAIDETAVMLRRLIGENIELALELTSEIPMVNADPGQFAQILVNLVVNARDAIRTTGSVVIETGSRTIDEGYARDDGETRPGRYVMLAVSDNGEGMDPETRKHIFEPFFTTKEPGRGTGLGLATVYGIVKQSGGNIWVYSEPGYGTTIKVFFPAVEEAAKARRALPATANFRFGHERILLVEDEAVVRGLAREVLESCGYTVIEATNGRHALEVVDGGSVKLDLLMTDVVMPEMGGRELAENIEEMYPQIKILFTSGYTDSAAVRQGILKQGTNFLPKPFTYDELAQKVRELLDSDGNGSAKRKRP